MIGFATVFGIMSSRLILYKGISRPQKKGCSGETRIDEFVFCDIRGAAHLPLIIVHNFGIKCLIRTQTSVCEYCLGRCPDGQIQPRRLETLGW